MIVLKETVVMAFIAGFLLDGKKCKRIYGHKYKSHFCVYAVDIIICFIILALLGTQAFMVKILVLLMPSNCIVIIRYIGIVKVNWIQNLENY